MKKSITPESLKTFANQANQDANRSLMERAVTTNGIYKASEHNALSATNTTVFSHEIETGAVTDQKDSGRCWLFATLNTMRHQIAKDYGLEDFELSESYSYFWDKLEKSNAFYEQIIATSRTSLDDRKLAYMFNHPQADGGWWEYASAVITKYGVVPKSVMPETIASSKSRQLNTLLNRKLRKDALSLRQLAKDGKHKDALRNKKEEMLGEVYRFLTIAIGTPPQSFDFSYRDKDKQYHRDDTITPLKFLEKYAHSNLSQYVSILNDPTKSYEQTYIFDGGGNVVDGPQPLFLNINMPTLKDLVYRQLQTNEPVWFGCDVYTDINKKGFMSNDTYDFNGTFDVDFSLSKAERLTSRDSSVTHAMTITGVDVVNNIPKQWKVENSWGEKFGLKGYYTMSSDWFDRNGYVVVIRRDLLDKQLLKALDKTPVAIPDWDPINASLVALD